MSGYQVTTPNYFNVRDPFARAQYDISVLQGKVKALEINNEQLLTLGPQNKANVQAYLQGKIDGSAAFVSAATSGSSSEGIHGAFACYGNAFTEEQEFVSVGSAKSDGTPYTIDTPIAWASSSKILTGMAIGKCIEEGILNTYDAVWPYILNNPTSGRSITNFTGSLTYITSVTGYGSAPAYTGTTNWVVSTGSFNVNEFTVQNLLAMNVGLQYPFTLAGVFAEGTYDYVGALNSLTQYPNTIAAAQVWLATKTYGLLAAGALTAREWQVWQQQSSPISYVQTFINAITFNQTSNSALRLPLLFRPTNYATSSGSAVRSTYYQTPEFGDWTPNNIYSPSLELLALVIDSAVQGHGYSSFTDYVNQKFFSPMNMTNSYVLGQVQLPGSVLAAMPTPQICRDAVMANPSNISITSLGGRAFQPIASALAGGTIAPGYTGASPSLLPFVVYWADDTTGGLNTDALATSYNTEINYYSNDDGAAGGAPLVSSCKDFVELLKLMINKGYYNNGRKQILNSATVDFLTTPSMNNSTSLIFNRYPFNTLDGNTYTWCAGGFQKLIGNGGNWQFGGQSQCSWSGVTNTIYFFDPISGYYMVAGSYYGPGSYIDSASSRNDVYKANGTTGIAVNTPRGIADALCDGPFVRSKVLQSMIKP